MKNLFTLIYIIAFISSCSDGEGFKAYDYNNPLHFYDVGFTINHIFQARFSYPPYAKPVYSNQGYGEINGFLSNTNYIIVIGLSNLAHIYYNGLIWQSNIFTNISLSNNYYSGEYFVNANEKYFATITSQYYLKVYLISNLQFVYQETNAPVYKQQALFGNGNSDILAYIYINTNARLVNLSNTNIIDIGNGFNICTFSQNNKYLFYTDFAKKSEYYFWDHYIYANYRKHIGQPFIYDIQNNTNYSIATYSCLYTGVGFNLSKPLAIYDGFYAIDYSLTNLFIYICETYSALPGQWDLYDGTYAPDAEGLYRIDISSLGLSE
jgi:hypothetical protein